MAIPATKAQLLSYCKRQLGAPVVEINVDDDKLFPVAGGVSVISLGAPDMHMHASVLGAVVQPVTIMRA